MVEIYLVYKNVGDRGNQTSMKPPTSTSRGKCTVWFNENVENDKKNINRLLNKRFYINFLVNDMSVTFAIIFTHKIVFFNYIP